MYTYCTKLYDMGYSAFQQEIDAMQAEINTIEENSERAKMHIENIREQMDSMEAEARDIYLDLASD